MCAGFFSKTRKFTFCILHTEEEVECSYEEFYEDVHTELLKFGEIVNFKVCRNGSFHLRGNVYIHYKSLDSAVSAYRSINARYFAGKQVNCEFVSVTKWKVAICGEYMKSRLKTCSRGTTCNFIHCFRNPGGDYEWADWDKPPPRFWTTKMISLFGFSDDSYYDNKTEQDRDRYYSRRSRSRERDSSSRSSRRNHEEHDVHWSSRQERHKNRTDSIDSDRELSDQGEERNKRRDHTRKSSKHHKEDSRTYRAESEDEREIQRRRKERKKREYTEDKSKKSDEVGRNLRRKVSRSSKEDSVLSEDYESQRSEMRRRSESSKNSTKWDLSSVEKIEANDYHRESADDILGKRKRHKRKHDSDYYNDDENDDRGRRSKSRDSKYYSDEKMDRWEPKIDAVG